MRELPLRKGTAVALVDDADYASLADYRWYGHRLANGTIYVARYERDAGAKRNRTVFLHRQLMAPAPGLVVDHINGDPLDNRRTNLRVCTVAENCRNRRRVARAGRTSRFKGVTWMARERRWRAAIGPSYARHDLGTFVNEEEAARAYDEAARIQYGEFARLNFPRAGEQAA